MPAPDRLIELQRQRALLQAQLVRLDREIAQAKLSPLASPTPDAPAPRHLARPPRATAVADPSALLADLLAEEKPSPSFSKAGCWFAFAAIMAAVIGTVIAVGHFFYR